MKKKIFLYCLTICLLLPIHVVFASTSYQIEAIASDESTTLVSLASTWEEALRIYSENETLYPNLLIRDDERILKVKYGIVAFHKGESCEVNTTYKQGAENGYTNGCYGIDAAYLNTSDDATKVDFLLSGAYGTLSIDDVDIYPIEISKRISSYSVYNNKLYHQIKTDIAQDTYSTSIYLGDAPEYLSNDNMYYSFDGHYFYQGDSLQGYYDMIDDLRSSTNAKAVNAQTPYYNYYQYISHRTKTSYSEVQINAYFDDTLHIQGPLTTYKAIGTSYHAILTQSMLKSQANAFLQYQDQFGANALMMMALSMNESATGRSYLAFTRNNVFGHAAFDSAVEENASRYHSIAASIYSHAKHYISNSYLNPNQFQYHGGYFGSKASGMNVSYASDPYWGEKAAQYYIYLDEALGEEDKDTYALGIIAQPKLVNVYEEATRSSEILYTNESLRDFVFIILEKQGAWYKIQSDPAQDDTGLYSFQNDIGYIAVADVDFILNEKSMKSTPSYMITFDANGGVFQGDTSYISLQIEENRIPSIVLPQKENSLCTGWDKSLSAVTKDMKYTAQYIGVQTMEVVDMKKTTYISGEQLDVSGAFIQLTLENNEKQKIPIDSSMITNFNTEEVGMHALEVTYQGNTTTIPITVEPSKEDEKEDIIQRIEALLTQFQEVDEMDEAQTQQLLSLKQEIDQDNNIDLPYGAYRKLDAAIQKAYGSSLQVIVNGDMQPQISGITIASSLASPTLIPTVIKFNISTGLSNSSQTMLSNIAQANAYTPETFFKLSGKKDFTSLELYNDVIVSLKKPENSQANTQYLIIQYKDNNVYQIPTSQTSNYITFATDTLGEYALLSHNTANIYDNNDIIENNYRENNGYDIYKLLFYGILVILLGILLLTTFLIRRKRYSHH